MRYPGSQMRNAHRPLIGRPEKKRNLKDLGVGRGANIKIHLIEIMEKDMDWINLIQGWISGGLL
jgi:hypothetical protein